MPTPSPADLNLTTSGPLSTITTPALPDLPLEFETLRQHGRIPQLAFIMRLVTRVVVATPDGIALNQLPDDVEELIHDGLQVTDLIEGSDGDQTSLSVQPGRQASFRIRIVNTTGKMSQFIQSDPLIGADAELVLSFPGLDGDQSFTRFKGEILALTLDDTALEIEAGSP
jgi:hypothetical protein